MSNLRVLIGFEHSGMVASAFRQAGCDAWSNDLRDYSGNSPWESPKIGAQFHIKADFFDALKQGPWDIVVAHVPCTYLSNSQIRWYDPKYESRNKPGGTLFGRAREAAQKDALKLFKDVWECEAPRLCIENPPGVAVSKLGLKPAQTIQPYQFGADASKRTAFWLRGLPALDIPDRKYWTPPRFVCPKCSKHPRSDCAETTGSCKLAMRWANQTDFDGSVISMAGMSKADRAKWRAITFPGVALAMAQQWTAAVRAEIGDAPAMMVVE